MSRKYKSPVFKSEYMKLLDQDGTKRLETDFNALQNQLESLKAEKKKMSPEKGEGDAETASPSKWGSSNKDEKYKARRLKQQSRKILGKEIDFGSVTNVRVLKPSPPKKQDSKSEISKNQTSKNQTSKHQTSNHHTSEKPESLLQSRESSAIQPVFAIITVSFEDTLIEFETNQNGFILLHEVQRYAPQAVGLCYITDEGKKRVLPVTKDAEEVRPPRGAMGWSTAKEYHPILPHVIRVPMTPKPKTPGPGMPARESGISISNAFDGVYDEAQNQREFQDAVMAFRNAGQNEQNSSKTDQKPKYKLKSRNVLSPTPISTQTVLPELDLKFASNMSNSDRLELEKLRNEFAEQNQPPPDILKITDDLPKQYFTDIKTQQKLDEIARERAEIREMFTNVAIEDDVISIDFDEASSSRTVTPVESPVKVVKSEGQAEEKMDGLDAGMSLTQIAGFQLDTDLLELQKHYKSEQNRPRTGIPKSRPTTGRERPVTPGTHWNMSSSVNVVKSVDLSSNLEWKYNNSYGRF